MTYEEMSQLKKNDRLQVYLNGEWKSGSFQSSVNGADPAMWFAYDEHQVLAGRLICTKIYTGLQFTKEYWEDPVKNQVFRWEPFE